MTSVVELAAEEERSSRFEKPPMRMSEFRHEIEEESSSELFEINSGVPMATIKEEVDGSVFSYDIHPSGYGGDDFVYVAVGKNEQLSKDALVWTINHAVHPSSTIVYLIHVFPQLHHIPTPLGKLPISQVNPEQKENYIIQERSKRTEFLHKFLHICSAAKVKVETVLIESDTEAKAILDLIPILNIQKLVLGTPKSSLRKLRSGKGNGSIADEILQNVPEFCEVKVICEGKEVCEEQMIESPSASASTSASPRGNEGQDQSKDSFTCSCFKPKVVS